MHKERPILENIIKENMSITEVFQNKTLRPVIKMQHLLLIKSFKNYLLNRKIDFSVLTDQKKKSRIKGIFTKDINYKNFTIGLIVGDFTTDEFHFYAENTSEINRRILQIITQRVQDSIKELE
ncbi:glyoxalase [uncultured Polaribacter sp.]|uniref:glyoxalase n=1 Tax=uncultured Polaribacter sp. TaxID=174711 RepID=UPI0026100E9C|nr:glyoxalase [uncultured Polaribacter sp.]